MVKSVTSCIRRRGLGLYVQQCVVVSLAVARRWGRRYFGGAAVMEVLRAAAELQIFHAARVTC